ncbi:hypothetical protein JTE90_022979 [Oedothorax gibbosus]|uniref:Uncharacterized protein n=1 Tax=Oedothorax gibbosus TaxID=931172 RepID=A0AAV6V9M8_9ARAC|nr:hypothetical protein JTE90_022979 [Oedothorax gibbosus]
MDRDDDIKSDDYEDLQKKPPMAIVGPVIMGIGGFAVVVGVFMCLVETNVCRRNNIENRSLIEHEDMIRDSAAAGLESGPTTVPSTSPRHRNGNARKHPSPRKTRSGKNTYSTKVKSNVATSPGTQATLPISVIGSKQLLSASDKFLTPPSSFTAGMHPNSRDAENQTSSSLMKSFTSSVNSWTVSTDFQTPNASSVENSMSLEASSNKRSDNTLDPTSLKINSSKFLTPKNSVDSDMPISSLKNRIDHKTFFSNAEVPNGFSENSHSDISDQIEMEKKHMNGDILVEPNTHMNSDIIDETSITPELEDDIIDETSITPELEDEIIDETSITPELEDEIIDETSITPKLEDKNLNTEYHSSSSPVEGTGETLPLYESGGRTKSHAEIAEVPPNVGESTKNKEKYIENSLKMTLDLPTEINKIDFNSANTVLNQENNGTDNKNICVDEDKGKSFVIEDKETISKELEPKCLETEVEYSRNESDTINTNNTTADISKQDNVCIEIEQKPIDCESTDNANFAS